MTTINTCDEKQVLEVLKYFELLQVFSKKRGETNFHLNEIFSALRYTFSLCFFPQKSALGNFDVTSINFTAVLKYP